MWEWICKVETIHTLLNSKAGHEDSIDRAAIFHFSSDKSFVQSFSGGVRYLLKRYNIPDIILAIDRIYKLCSGVLESQ